MKSLKAKNSGKPMQGEGKTNLRSSVELAHLSEVITRRMAMIPDGLDSDSFMKLSQEFIDVVDEYKTVRDLEIKK
ncbi:hypothetical protein SAMN05421759_102639 [Roseivivax lentus]|uniref:Uncharacterized protein n=1 Tax=Roseivivax lentus TaxID=633194 RepID=A0A1N7LEQ0_9RHOB|nr:hypothetical protein [Roseivivax lentus]SIS72294.1 hypothetical protein SAMN05421759_102639 [Roseivivax lentus]